MYLSLSYLFLFILFLLQQEKFGILIGETVYFPNGFHLQLPFPSSIDLVVENDEGYFFILLYFFSLWEGIRKDRIYWTNDEGNKIFYSFRGNLTKIKYYPYVPIKLKGKGNLVMRERRKLCITTRELGKNFPQL